MRKRCIFREKYVGEHLALSVYFSQGLPQGRVQSQNVYPVWIAALHRLIGQAFHLLHILAFKTDEPR